MCIEGTSDVNVILLEMRFFLAQVQRADPP